MFIPNIYYVNEGQAMIYFEYEKVCDELVPQSSPV